MIKISDIVFEIINSDEISLEAIRMGILNLSAYAKKIQSLVSEKSRKQASVGAIVIALSRMKKKLNNIPPLRPSIIIEDMNIKSPLVEISYDRTAKLFRIASKLDQKLLPENGFFTITYGLSEISLIVSANLKNKILKHFGVQPKGIYESLVAITVRFNKENYIKVPNVIYALIGALAGKRINIIEIVSTFTEISIIIKEKNMQQTVNALKYFFYKNELNNDENKKTMRKSEWVSPGE
ncbi:MAG: hypothetical protein COU70_00385 [Parcubacteria group bacterium CG10_big_fil_rev_8_21_14_0_10_35_15]|nr:MAG: hypothetical protein COU70_00385 [Parcubacteria group bacterium CG10_big_fil_rev_8_21_14_0_10_35_15]